MRDNKPTWSSMSSAQYPIFFFLTREVDYKPKQELWSRYNQRSDLIPSVPTTKHNTLKLTNQLNWDNNNQKPVKHQGGLSLRNLGLLTQY